MNNNEKEALRWFLQGIRDGRTAGRNSENGDNEVACFLYQQAAEKLLKAFLYFKGENPVLGHSALKLAERCEGYDPSFHGALQACMDLDVFYVPTRYPNGIPDGAPYEYFQRRHADAAGQSFTAVKNLVEPFFGPLNPGF
ncbi:MAG: HEPN domain-containing protein [Spirochaetia bacterium]|jgi:HEPN domain-containing protein